LHNSAKAFYNRRSTAQKRSAARLTRGTAPIEGVIMASPSTHSSVAPAVLDNLYPVWDRAGNKMQRIRLRFVCGHEETSYHLDLGHGWRPRTKRQILEDELRITCPLAWKVCRDCEAGA
jgi:hypothetical protein